MCAMWPLGRPARYPGVRLQLPRRLRLRLSSARPCRQRQTVLWAGPCIYHTIEARPMSFSLDLFLPPLFASTWPLFRSHSPKAVSIRISESLCCTLDPTFWICAMHLHSQSTQSPLSYPCPLYDRQVKRCTCANAAGVRYF